MAGGEYHYDVTEAIAPTPIYASADKPVREALASYAAGVIIDHIRDRWPVVTSTSLAGFRTWRENGHWVIRNDVDYTTYVRDGYVYQLQAAGLAMALGGLATERRRVEAARGLTRTAVSMPRSRLDYLLAQRQARAVKQGLQVVGPVLERSAVRLGVRAAQISAVRGMLGRSDFRAAADTLRGLGLLRAAEEIEHIIRRARL